MFWAKCSRILGSFVLKKDESKLELAMPILVKARDPFLRIRKKMSPALSLDVGKQSALAITEEKAPTPVQKKAPPPHPTPPPKTTKERKRKCVKPATSVSQDPKWNAKSVSP